MTRASRAVPSKYITPAGAVGDFAIAWVRGHRPSACPPSNTQTHRCSMPSPQRRPGAQLALRASHELLALTATPVTHPASEVKTLINHAADALRALTDSLSDVSGESTASTGHDQEPHPGLLFTDRQGDPPRVRGCASMRSHWPSRPVSSKRRRGLTPAARPCHPRQHISPRAAVATSLRPPRAHRR